MSETYQNQQQTGQWCSLTRSTALGGSTLTLISKQGFSFVRKVVETAQNNSDKNISLFP